MAIDNITGTRFGNLVAQELVKVERRRAYWRLVCDCGNVVVAMAQTVKAGKKKSCGCRRSDHLFTHGKSKTRLYRIWQGMRYRCENPRNEGFKNYGGRGVTVSGEWLDFDQFQKWAIEAGYRDDLEIDRIDVNGNYEQKNCHWVSRIENQKNKRTTRKVIYAGKEMCLSDAAKTAGIKPATVFGRLGSGMTVEEALSKTVPPQNEGCCRSGHALSQDNIYTSTRGERLCRACMRARKSRYRAKIRQPPVSCTP